MRFERDLFISYAHIDNRPISPSEIGWITRFHEALQTVLSMRIARRVEIWRDTKLTGNDVFADEIVAQFEKTAVLVAVLSPGYVKSEWCRREATEFCRVAEQADGLLIGNKARLLKVIKTPVENQEPLPRVMKEMLGFEFFVLDDQQNAFELDPAFGPEMVPKFNVRLVQLAEQIKQLLKQLDDEEASPHGEAATPGRPAVYLAECSYDRRDARDAIRTELRMRGYTVLPERELPRQESEYVAEVERLLERCGLAVHIVGAQLGAVPDGPSQRSVAMLQNDLAARRSRSHGLARVIWLPREAASTDPQQQAFVDALQRDAAAQFGADLITGDVEALKSAVAGTLHRIETKKAAAPIAAITDESSALVYLICDARDRESKATLPVRRFLKSHGVDVELPLFEGDAATVRQAHLDRLAQADLVMVFYGAGDELWKRTVDADLRKARAARHERRVAEPLTFVATPRTADKNDLLDLGDRVIDALGDLPEDALMPLVRALGIS